MADKKKYGFNGKYCTGCNSVWEMVTTTGEAGWQVRYPDFPSYGLERKDCFTCAGTSPKATPATPAQKMMEEHQKLFVKHVKKQSK